VGTPGGCNPIPLPSTTDRNSIVIREADLAAKVQVFER